MKRSETPALLTVRDLHVRYRDDDGDDDGEVHAVRGARFDVAAGESVGVLGESGCGKTSLALALVGLLPTRAAVSGRIELWETALADLDELSWRSIRGDRIGIVFQQPSQSLSPYRRVGRQIADVLRSHGLTDERSVDRDDRVAELLAEVGLETEIAGAYPHQLSGGQLQRIVLCQALSCKPDLLLADEPTASLDSETETRILDLVGRLRRQRGLALLWISHDPRVLERVSDRLLVMNAGRIVEEGDTVRVLSAPEHEVTRELLSYRRVER